MLKKTFIHDVDFLNDKKVRVIRLSIEHSDFIFSGTYILIYYILSIYVPDIFHQKCFEINNQGN